MGLQNSEVPKLPNVDCSMLGCMTGTLIFGDILDDSTRRGVVAFVLLRSASGGSWLRLYKGALDSLNLNLVLAAIVPLQ